MKPLNSVELADQLSMHPSTLSKLKQSDPSWVKQFEVARPRLHQQRRYSPSRVAEYLAGRSLVRIGAGSRRAS